MAPFSITEGSVGYWGHPTSTLDWCEANYEVSYFIAEFWNTISNLSMIIPPIYGIIQCYQFGLELVFTLNYALLLLTGIGSWMFHMTLLYEMQLLDELPMVWGASYMLYTLYMTDVSPKKQRKSVGTVIILYATILTITYLITKNSFYYQILYGVLVSANIILGIKRNYMNCGETTGLLFFGGLVLYALGFMFWNIDTQFCGIITSSRNTKMLNHWFLTYLSPITQLHGWWHVMAGYAGYIHIILCIQHRLNQMKIKNSIEPSIVGLKISVHKISKQKMS